MIASILESPTIWLTNQTKIGSMQRRFALIKTRYWLGLLTPFLMSLSGCGGNKPGGDTLDVWAHAGRESERETIEKQVAQFNSSQDEVTVNLTFIPEGSYNAQVQAASLSGDLPDVLEFDGPFVYNYAWQGNLVPLDELLSDQVREDLLPSVIQQGTYQNRLYSIGTFESTLVLYGHRSQLEAAGVRIPTHNEDAWTVEEFNQVLAKLAEKDPDGQVLDLKLNYQGEWFTYGFAPMLNSAGGDLLTNDLQSAKGMLNSPSSVTAMEQVQSWIQKGYVDPNIDDAAFTQGRVALSWVGHWVYGDYAEAVKDDLVIIPLPDFGQGSKTGQGSWNWGITTNCPDPQEAIKFVEFLLQPEQVLAMAKANGAIPGTKRAIAQSPLHAKDGPLSLFAEQLLSGKSVPRPQTPAYPVITSAFQRAFADIRHGIKVKTALDKAATTIDIDMQDNQGYPFVFDQ